MKTNEDMVTNDQLGQEDTKTFDEAIKMDGEYSEYNIRQAKSRSLKERYASRS